MYGSEENRPTVVLAGTLDTKGAEYRYARAETLRLGARAIVIDFGVFGDGGSGIDISAHEVARRGGAELGELRVAREGSDTRARAMSIMTEGLTRIVRELVLENRCHAMLGFGGSGGSSVISAVMRDLPIGFPKMLVSTMASGDISGYVGESDMTVMHSVTDILGLNRISKAVIGNAVAAAVGMASARWEAVETPASSSAPLVALTMFGVTTPCVQRLCELLSEQGFDTVVFHAVGSGGRAMEHLVEKGMIDGVIDVTTSEIVDAEYGGIFAGSPERMSVAPRSGIPSVVVPGAMEVLNFGPVETVPEKYDRPERKLIVHNTSVCAVRVTADEAAHLGRVFAERLAEAGRNTAVLLPTGGFSNYSKAPDGPWMDREADRRFREEFERVNEGRVPVIEIAANINDPIFADAAFDAFMRLWSAREVGER